MQGVYKGSIYVYIFLHNVPVDYMLHFHFPHGYGYEKRKKNLSPGMEVGISMIMNLFLQSIRFSIIRLNNDLKTLGCTTYLYNKLRKLDFLILYD